jgi:SAM-dependent methyltransferase
MYTLPATPQDWSSQIDQVKNRFNREFRQEALSLPPEVEAMPLFRQWVTHELTKKITSPFWELGKFQKNQRCLDIGCGVSFLVYDWCTWQTFFYGHEICVLAKDALNSRAPQLNSKLFKGVKLGTAHQLDYESQMFDRVVATGFSCYYPPAYWDLVITAVKRVLKPEGLFIFDAVNPDAEIAENWAILEMYLGAEVFLSPLVEFTDLIKAAGGKVSATKAGELFQMYQVQFDSKGN